MLETILEARPGFVASALFVTAVGLVVLTLAAVNLHLRVSRLERERGAEPEEESAYDRLRGVDLTGILGEPPPWRRGRGVVAVLSWPSPSGRRILEGMEALDRPAAVAWRDGRSPDPSALPDRVPTLEDDGRLAEALEIGVTPFALVVDAGGTVVRAAPVDSVDALHTLDDASTREEAA